MLSYTVPSPVEEGAAAEIRFDVSGDVQLLNQAEMTIHGKDLG